MCVAISRARERLIVVGDAHTLKADKLWSRLHSVAFPAVLNADVIPHCQVSSHIYYIEFWQNVCFIAHFTSLNEDGTHIYLFFSLGVEL